MLALSLSNIRPPDINQMAALSRLSRFADAPFRGWTAIDSANVRKWSSFFPLNSGKMTINPTRLYHPVYLVKSQEIRKSCCLTTDSERVLAESLFGELSGALSSREKFVEFLLLIHRSLNVGSPSRFREHSIGTQPGADGKYIVYPLPEEAERIISIVWRTLKAGMGENAFFRSVLVYVLINGAHPFSDGNGRLSRVLFNIINMSAYRVDAWLPIKELSLLSSKGLLLRMRQAHFFGEWEPVFKFFYESLQMLTNIQTETLLAKKVW